MNDVPLSMMGQIDLGYEEVFISIDRYELVRGSTATTDVSNYPPWLDTFALYGHFAALFLSTGARTPSYSPDIGADTTINAVMRRLVALSQSDTGGTDGLITRLRHVARIPKGQLFSTIEVESRAYDMSYLVRLCMPSLRLRWTTPEPLAACRDFIAEPDQEPPKPKAIFRAAFRRVRR